LIIIRKNIKVNQERGDKKQNRPFNRRRGSEGREMIGEKR
jgi:hypothetical protein